MSGNFPYYKVYSRGKEITPLIRGALVELRLEDRSGVHADALELELADAGELSWPSEGVEMGVEFGVSGVKREHQRFAIDQAEHAGPPARFTVSATAADFTSQARAPRERSWSVKPFGELVTEIAGEYGYGAKVQPESLASVTLQHVDQAGQSDLALIHQIAEEHGAVFKPVDRIWWVRSYDALGEPVATIRPGDVSTWRAHFVPRRRYASVAAAYQDYDQAERVQVVVGDGEPQKVMDKTFADEATARTNARAALGRSEREARQLTLRMPGRPDLASQQVIALDGFRDRVDGRWLITQVTHTINKRGYSCRVQCEGV